MSKLICDICGTSYPDTSTQCPICGCVRPAESTAVADSDQENRGYTYVKGGRFSKSNVKKRNSSSARAEAGSSARRKQAPSKKVLPMVIVLVLLFLIVACMIGFIVSTLIGNNGGDLFGKDDTSQTDNIERPCTGITLSKSSLTFTAVGEEFTLKTICAPTNTTDEKQFSSSDETVATVTQDGKVVCVGAGEAVIYVYCGEKKDECLVTCNLDEQTEDPTQEETEAVVSVQLTRQNITDANFPGYSWNLYEPGDIPAEELTWVSEDSAVATVDAKGLVTAVAEGSTVIRVYYNGQEVASCSITCDFSQQDPMDPEGGTATYVPYTIYGSIPFEKDRDCYTMTMALNERVGLFLRNKDNPDDKVEVVWTVVEGDCRIDADGAGVTATSERNCKIKAEYNGQIFYILIY